MGVRSWLLVRVSPRKIRLEIVLSLRASAQIEDEGCCAFDTEALDLTTASHFGLPHECPQLALGTSVSPKDSTGNRALA